VAPWQGKGATGHVAQSDLKNNKANGLTVTAGAKVKVESSVVVGNSDAGVSISDLATGASPCARVHPSTLATQRLHAHSNTTCMASVSSFLPRLASCFTTHSDNRPPKAQTHPKIQIFPFRPRISLAPSHIHLDSSHPEVAEQRDKFAGVESVKTD